MRAKPAYQDVRRRPIRNRKTAYILSSLATLTMWAVAWLMFTYLPISPERLGLSVGCLLSGGVLGLLIFWLIATLPDKKSVRISRGCAHTVCSSNTVDFIPDWKDQLLAFWTHRLRTCSHSGVGHNGQSTRSVVVSSEDTFDFKRRSR